MLGGEDPGEEIDQPEREMTLAEAVERQHERQDRILIGRRQLDGALRPSRCRAGIREGNAGELPGGEGRIVAPSAPLTVDPSFRLRGTLDVEAVEEMAPIELERLGQIVPVDRGVEGGGIAPEGGGFHRHLVVAPADDQVGTTRLAQEVERPTECRAGVLLIEVRPEPGEERVPPDRSARRRGREVDQQGQSLGLLENGPQLAARRRTEIGGTEGPQFDWHQVRVTKG